MDNQFDLRLNDTENIRQLTEEGAFVQFNII